MSELPVFAPGDHVCLYALGRFGQVTEVKNALYVRVHWFGPGLRLGAQTLVLALRPVGALEALSRLQLQEDQSP